MQRRLTVTISDDVYRGLHDQIGRGQISRFIEDLVRPHLTSEGSLDHLYREAGHYSEAEREASDWLEADLDGDRD
jgi:predicted CopG family antitoxin